MKRCLMLALMGIIMGLTSCDDNEFSKSKAFIMSQDFVKEQLTYPMSADFNSTYFFEEEGKNSGYILGKFTAKNTYGMEREYAYKAWMTYKGGEWTDIYNWLCLSLRIEDVQSRQVVFDRGYDKGVKEAELKVEYVDFGHYKCKVHSIGDYFVRIITPKKLSQAEIKKYLPSFQYKSKEQIFINIEGDNVMDSNYALITSEGIDYYE